MSDGDKPVVLVAVEPRCYREAIGGMLAVLRPNLDVRVTNPPELAAKTARTSPRVVISGLPPPPADERDGTAWIRIVFPAEPGTWVAVEDAPFLDRPDFGIEHLLDIVDELGGPTSS